MYLLNLDIIQDENSPNHEEYVELISLLKSSLKLVDKENIKNLQLYYNKLITYMNHKYTERGYIVKFQHQYISEDPIIKGLNYF